MIIEGRVLTVSLSQELCGCLPFRGHPFQRLKHTFSKAKWSGVLTEKPLEKKVATGSGPLPGHSTGCFAEGQHPQPVKQSSDSFYYTQDTCLHDKEIPESQVGPN